MTAWSVLVEARGDGDVSPGAVDAFATATGPLGGAVTGGSGAWSARVSLDAASAAAAASTASIAVCALAADAGLPHWPVARIEAVREDVYDEDLARPQLPDLVSAPEAAEILGVSAQRVHVLAGQHKGFPRPAYQLRSGKIWLRAAVVAFGERWDRKPGRPRKDREVA